MLFIVGQKNKCKCHVGEIQIYDCSANLKLEKKSGGGDDNEEDNEGKRSKEALGGEVKLYM